MTKGLPRPDAGGDVREALKFARDAIWSGGDTVAALAKIDAALANSADAAEPMAWMHEDELPKGYPYETMFKYSEVRGGVRMFPVYAPPASNASAEARDGAIYAAISKAAMSAEEQESLNAHIDAALSAGGDEATKSEGGSMEQPFALTDAVRESPAPRAFSGKQEGRTGSKVGASQIAGSSMSYGPDKPIIAEQAFRPSDPTAAPAAVDVEAIKRLVSDAYNQGFTEGMREHTSRRGGKPWSEARAYYEKRALSLLNASDAERAR